MLGGGMRQAGIIAAAGIIALEQMVDRLAEDHANARRLAEGLTQLPDVQIDLQTVQTNIVIFQIVRECLSTQTFMALARQHGLNVGEFGYGRIRAVLHYGITTQDVDTALTIIDDILRHDG